MTDRISPGTQAVYEATRDLPIEDAVAFFVWDKARREALAIEDPRAEAVSQEVERLWVRHEASEVFESERYGERPLVTATESDIFSRPAPEWWVEGLIQKGTIAVLAGSGGVGKTFLSLHFSRSIATGISPFGWAPKRGRVLYVVAEGASAFGKRARAWNDYHGVAPGDGSITYVEAGVNLSVQASVDRLADLFEEGAYDLLVIDTYSQLSGVTEENNAAQNASVFNRLRDIRERVEGSSVLVIHHTDAAGTKARGSTAIRDNADTVIMAKAANGAFTLSTRAPDGGKQKDGRPVKLERFKLQDHLDSAVVVQGSKPVNPLWAPISEALAEGLVLSSAELRKACGIEEPSGSEYDKWKAYVKRLAEDGVITKTGPSNSPSYALTLTPEAARNHT